MVCWLIENKQIHWFQQQANHRQTASLATTKHLNFLVTLLTTKHKCPEYILDAQTDIALSHIVDSLEHSKILIQQLCLILCEIAYLDIMAYLQFASKRNLVHDTLHESRFSFTVLADESHLLTSLNRKSNMIKDGMSTIILTYFIADHGIVAASQTGWEFQMHSGVIHLVYLDRHNLLQLLYLLLHLYSLSGLITESLDKGLHISHFLLLVLIGSQLLLPAFLSEYNILVVFHLIVDYLATGYLQRTIGDIIYKGPVVTHKHYRTRALRQKLLQPLDTLDIEMVRRLVEQQHIGFLKQYLRQFDTHTPTS